MDLLSQNKSSLWDPVRKKWVSDTAEERVRQMLLRQMIDNLGFPKELIAVEKEIKRMPHLNGSSKTLPTRRADIVCFAKGLHSRYPLYPLIIVECKGEEIHSKALDQVLGYNHIVQAYFVAVAGSNAFFLSFVQKGEQRIFPFFYPDNFSAYLDIGLPSFQELMRAVRPC